MIIAFHPYQPSCRNVESALTLKVCPGNPGNSPVNGARKFGTVPLTWIFKILPALPPGARTFTEAFSTIPALEIAERAALTA